MLVVVDGQPLGESIISPGSAGTDEVSMSEGEHAYTLLDQDVVVDGTTQTAPDCSTHDPGTAEPGGYADGTGEPGDDTGTPVTSAPTPEIPRVVHTG